MALQQDSWHLAIRPVDMPDGSSLGFPSNRRHLPLRGSLHAGRGTHGRDGLLRRCRTVVRCSLLPGEIAWDTSDSGSCDPTLLVSVVGVIDRVRLPLGYEHYDAHLRAVWDHLLKSNWPGQTGRSKSHQARGVSVVPLCLAPSRLQIRLRMRCSTGGLTSDDRGS